MVETLYKAEVVAPQVGLSIKQFYAACQAKQFPHVRIGRRIRVPESALRRWIEQQLAGNAPAQSAAASAAAA